jgi:pseudouridine 5'-phosphatase
MIQIMKQDSRPQAVVFDLDGLMFNTEDLYDQVSEELLDRRGCRYSADLKRRMMGLPEIVSLQIMIDEHRLDGTAEQLLAESDAIFADVLPGNLAPMPGLLRFLDGLEAAGIPKAIATSSRRCFATSVLSHFGFEPRFRFLLTSEDVVYGKPHPEIYRMAADRLGLDPSRILVLEDSENGCRAAVAAGAWTVAIPGQHNAGQAFPGVRLIADSLADPRIFQILGLASGHHAEGSRIS